MRLSYIAILFIAFSTASALPMPIPDNGDSPVCTLLSLLLRAMVDSLWENKACQSQLRQLLGAETLDKIEAAEKGKHGSMEIHTTLPDGRKVEVEIFPPSTPQATIEKAEKQLEVEHRFVDRTCRMLMETEP
jgi:hypothetical protein